MNNGFRRSGLLLAELVLFHGAVLAAAVTGLALLWLRFFAKPEDPFAAFHPALPFWQHLHVLVVPALGLALGVVWAPYAHTFFRAQKPRRWSGLALLLLGLGMVFSGALCQVSVAAAARRAWGVTHGALGVAWLAALGAHLLSRQKNGPPKG
ncbi:MAG: hypothetical protein ACP5NF_10965 [Thermoanaerobaculum sp.]